MNLYAYKFNKESNVSLEDLKDSKVYKLWEKINNSQKDDKTFGLTTKDEEWIVEHIYDNSYFKNGSIPLKGWAFDFKPICKEYWYKINMDEEIKLLSILAPSEKAATKYIEDFIFIDSSDEILEIRFPTNKIIPSLL